MLARNQMVGRKRPGYGQRGTSKELIGWHSSDRFVVMVVVVVILLCSDKFSLLSMLVHLNHSLT